MKYKYAENAITVTSHNMLLDGIQTVFTCFGGLDVMVTILAAHQMQHH